MQALKILEDDMQCDVIKIGGLVHNKVKHVQTKTRNIQTKTGNVQAKTENV
jgi:ribosomal RNA assembly protein